ncbi:MAG: SGNH/GDSL hydrolase family protein [Sumerlaeia bacterium]
MALSLAGAPAVFGEDFERLVILGDSLSDYGNATAAVDAAGIRTEFPPSPPYAEGRLSNGPLWIEQFADQWPFASGERVSYAFIGAATGRDNVLDSTGQVDLPGLRDELELLVADFPASDSLRGALVSLWIGANDYDFTEEALELVPGVIAETRAGLELLIAHGAETIVVPNLPNLGLTPRGAMAADVATAIAVSHNLALEMMLDDLARTTGALLISVDVFDLTQRIAADPGAYGFTDVSVPCVIFVPLSICGDASGKVFFDDLHPTTKAHGFIAEEALRTVREALGGPRSPSGWMLYGVAVGSVAGKASS